MIPWINFPTNTLYSLTKSIILNQISARKLAMSGEVQSELSSSELYFIYYNASFCGSWIHCLNEANSKALERV